MSLWEDYLGGPDDAELEPNPTLEAGEEYIEEWNQSAGESTLEVLSDGGSGISVNHGEHTTREERFGTFWAARTAAVRLQAANATITRDSNQYVVRFSWPRNTPLPSFRAGQRYAPEEIAFIGRSYADWMPICTIANYLHRKAGAVEGRLNTLRLRYRLRTFDEGSVGNFDEINRFLGHLLEGKPFTCDQAALKRFSQFGVQLETEPCEDLRRADLTKQQLGSLLSAFLASPIYPPLENQLESDTIRNIAEFAIQCSASRVGARLALHTGDPVLFIRALRGADDLGKGWQRIRSRTMSYLRFALLKSFPEYFESFQNSLYRRRDDYSFGGGFSMNLLDFNLSDVISGDISSQTVDAQAIIRGVEGDLQGLANLVAGGHKLAAWFAADLCRQRMWKDSSVPLDADRTYREVARDYRPSTETLMEILRVLLPFDKPSAERIAENISL